MRNKISVLAGIAALACCGSLFAHSGTTDSNGCHANFSDKGVTCHCHKGNDYKTELACRTGPLAASEHEDETETETETEIWKGLVVAPEDNCSDYDRDLYPYDSGADRTISDMMGGMYAPYEDTCFDTLYGNDGASIEHMVAMHQAHVSGMCAASPEMRYRFSNDLLNLTLATPGVNSNKSNQDVANWQPTHNKCWFVWRVFQVKKKYGMTVDAAERDAMQALFEECTADKLFMVPRTDCLPSDPLSPELELQE